MEADAGVRGSEGPGSSLGEPSQQDAVAQATSGTRALLNAFPGEAFRKRSAHRRYSSVSFPREQALLSLPRSYKMRCQEPAEVLWGENQAWCHRTVRKTCKKSEKGEWEERKPDVSAINNSGVDVSVFLTLKARSQSYPL